MATGLVVVGDLIGAGAAQERGVVGETPNLAARLQALAEPDTLVIAEATRRLIGDLFELEDLGPHAGLCRAERAWRVVGESGASAGSRRCAGGRRRWSGVRRRSSCCCGAGSRPSRRGAGGADLGRAGIGKSRLHSGAAEKIADEPHARLRYFCSPHHQDSALQPFMAQLDAPPVSRATTRPKRGSPSCGHCSSPVEG